MPIHMCRYIAIDGGTGPPGVLCSEFTLFAKNYDRDVYLAELAHLVP